MRTHKIIEKSEAWGKTGFDASESVFVTANAGSGKTTQLTARVLSLLLGGASPSKILCLTYTKAAAAEMQQRILSELGKWVMLDEPKLAAEIQALLGRQPDKSLTARARSLFATVLDAPEGVRIQTIHSFCQSLLRRFPLEAGVSPHFTVLDSRSEQELLKDARLRLFNDANHSPELKEAISELARLSSEDFQKLLSTIVKKKFAFREILRFGGVEAAAKDVQSELGITPGATMDSLADDYFTYDDITHARLRQVAEKMLAGTKTDIKKGEAMAVWLAANKVERAGKIEDYIRCFLKADYTKPEKLFSQGTLADEADVKAIYAEQDRAARFHEARQSLRIAHFSTSVLHIAAALLAIYDELKAQYAKMDYDDLILGTRELLSLPHISPWVLYKLDGGIDHVLVDEAQDTSPHQWQIVDKLTDDFFAGESRGQDERSLFIVGDEKQSIFSFQGADVRQLQKWLSHFAGRIEGAGKKMRWQALEKSYRSAPQVLEAVDATFARVEAKKGVLTGEAILRHEVHLAHVPGTVEMWPLVAPQENDYMSPPAKLAKALAETIRGWLDSGLWLEGSGRAIEPGDVMILVRTRTPFVHMLVRALKRHNVPVAGVDRMMLRDNLAVQDLMALGTFLLLPEDDLNLAALFKSPVGGISEEELFHLSHGRGEKSLWERLRERAPNSPVCEEAFALLSDLLSHVDYLPPYELYAYALDTLGLRRRFIGRMGEEYQEAIDEFMSQALLYEDDNTPSLQGFIHWLENDESEIKRDMEQAAQNVRILTVHGAKGLEAPVVILADTTSLPTMRDTLFWHGCEKGNLPLWVPETKQNNELTSKLREQCKEAAEEEYRRLLYVAMTRAREQLYVCGSMGRNKPNDNCWYRLMENAFGPIATACETPAGEGLRIGSAPQMRPEQSRAASQGRPRYERNEALLFLRKAPPREETPPRPLSPSKLGEEPAAASPLDSKVYARGRFIHALLQHLPSISPEGRAQAAETLSLPYRQDMDATAIAAAIAEAESIIAHPDFAFLFSPEALAEVPIAGTVTMQERPVVVSGQIDRLAITEDAVWVVDYKTNREPPKTTADTPQAYLKQMASYRLLLSHIYPGKPVRAALLWTAYARMDILDEALLDTYI